MKHVVICAVVVCMIAGVVQSTYAEHYTIATVVKAIGYSWFERMRVGVQQFGKDTGHKTFVVGPPKAGMPAKQAEIIENLIAQDVDAICVVPFAPEVLEDGLKKAMEHGIVVISHEATNLQNCHYDIEAFDNAAYGAHLMDYLAGFMGEQGQYAVFVGSLASKSHNEWVNAAIARQKEQYPGMELATDRIEEFDDQHIAYIRTKKLLKAHPDLKGIQGSAMSTVPGASRAVQEKGLQDTVSVVGTSLVGANKPYLRSGAADLISFWDPAGAGYVMNRLAVMVLEGQEITEGTDLGVAGYRNLTVNGKILYGSAWVDVTEDNMDEYDF